MHHLPLPLMLACLLALCCGTAFAVVVALNVALRRSGRSLDAPLPLRESVVSAGASLFGLMIAFSAAGIWADAARARAAVERETDALENVAALAEPFPAATREALRTGVAAYAKEVLAQDWPRMREGAPIDHPAYAASEQTLLALLAAATQAEAAAPPARGLVTQLFDARAARSARLLTAGSGMSRAQWASAILVAILTVVAMALVNAHSRRSQWIATQIFAALVAAVIFAILAHDRPFAGSISIAPLPFERLAK